MQRQLRANKKKTLAKGKAKKPEDPQDPEEDDLGSTKGPKRATKPKDDKNLKKGKGKPGDSAATKKAAANAKKKPAKQDEDAAANAKKKPAKQDEDVEEEGERQLGCPTCRFVQQLLWCLGFANVRQVLDDGEVQLEVLEGEAATLQGMYSCATIADVLITIFTIVSYMPLDYTQEYEAMELYVGEPAVSQTMKANGLKVAAITWGPDSLDFMCHGFQCLRKLTMHVLSKW
eukprot:s95_g6.t1